MLRRPPRSTRTDTLFPYTTLFRSAIILWNTWGLLTDAVKMSLDAVPPGIDPEAVANVHHVGNGKAQHAVACAGRPAMDPHEHRSEEHTSELQSLMRISYAVFCLKKKKRKTNTPATVSLLNIK